MGIGGSARKGGPGGDALAAGIDRLLAETGAGRGIVLTPAARRWRFLRGRDSAGGDLDPPDSLPHHVCERVRRDGRGLSIVESVHAPRDDEDVTHMTVELWTFLPLLRERGIVGVAWLATAVAYGGDLPETAAALPHLRSLADAVARCAGQDPESSPREEGR